MKKLIYLFSLTTVLYSCSDYTDVGENPNQLHTDQAQPDQYLSAAQTMSYSLQATTMERLGLLFSNACGGNVQTYSSPFNSEFSFNLTTTFYAGIFNNTYLNTNIFQKIINYDDVNSKFVEFKAIAKIYKVYNMQYLVDLYGDVPYDDIFLGMEDPTPSYNDDFYVYKKLFTELDEARVLIDDLGSGTYPNSTGLSASTDMVFGGDMAKWKSFANTIELKMLVRMSKCTGAAATYRDTRLADMVANGNNNFITSDVTIQPGYSTARTSTLNPQFYYFVSDNLRNPTDFNVYCPSGHILKCLNAYSNLNFPSTSPSDTAIGTSAVLYPNVADPRRAGMFSGSTSPRGVTQGSTVVDVFKAPGTSVGQPSKFAGYFFNLYDNAGLGSASLVVGSASGLFPSATVRAMGSAKGFIMTMAESYFLQAEAAHLGTSVPSYALLGLNAQSAFTSGVSSSMDQYKVSASNRTTYATAISNAANTNLKNFWYNPSNSYDQNYNAIMYQKWLSVIPNNAIECYLDNTRTGYPITPLPLNTSARPNRLLYPNSEYIANSANVPNVTSAHVFSVNSYSPFWLQ